MAWDTLPPVGGKRNLQKSLIEGLKLAVIPNKVEGKQKHGPWVCYEPYYQQNAELMFIHVERREVYVNGQMLVWDSHPFGKVKDRNRVTIGGKLDKKFAQWRYSDPENQITYIGKQDSNDDTVYVLGYGKVEGDSKDQQNQLGHEMTQCEDYKTHFDYGNRVEFGK